MEKSQILGIISVIILEAAVLIAATMVFGWVGAFACSFSLLFIMFFVSLLFSCAKDEDIHGVSAFIFALLGIHVYIFLLGIFFLIVKNLITEGVTFDGISCAFILFVLLFGVPLFITYNYLSEVIPYIYAYIKGVDGKYAEFVEDNKVSLGLFTRPALLKYKIILANKYLILEFDTAAFSLGAGKVTITDKTNGHVYKVVFARGSGKRNKNRKFEVFEHLCRVIDYNTVADDLVGIAEYYNADISMFIEKVSYIDINQCSEAELTAIPGVTIAKAKHAVKMRKKYAFYISMKQFYETVGLEEEFIEQIQSRGNKIILNSLPEYKRLNGQVEG